MHWKVLIILLICTCAYVLLGALGFHYIERPNEASLEPQFRAAAQQFLSRYTCVDPKNFTDFLSSVLDAYKAGYRLAENGTVLVPAPKWDYSSSVFFSMTVVTTIGYGNLSPSTPGGQIFCCLFALIGIPLLAVLLSGLAERLKSLRARVAACACWGNSGGEASSRTPEVVTGLLYTLLGFLVFFVAPAAVFSTIEGWSYGVAIYYCFITLMTIGFGDYVAGQTMTSAIYKLLLSLWIYLGLIFMSGVISTVQGFMEKGAKGAEARVGANDEHRGDDEVDPASAEESKIAASGRGNVMELEDARA